MISEWNIPIYYEEEIKNEVWKDVDDYKGLYQISSLGRVKSLNYGNTKVEKLLKLNIDKDGYHRIGLSSNGNKKYFYVHKLLLETFKPTDDKTLQVNHKDQTPDKELKIVSNNRIDNLEWCTIQYNNTYGDRIEKAKLTKIKNNSYGVEKTVYQYTKDKVFIKEWKSGMEVQRELGYQSTLISRNCRGKIKSSSGYFWTYEKIA